MSKMSFREAFDDYFHDGLRIKYGTVFAHPPLRQALGKRSGRTKFAALDSTNLPSMEELLTLKVDRLLESTAHIYLRVENEFLEHGLDLLAAWGFDYKSNLIVPIDSEKRKIESQNKDAMFFDATEMVLFGVCGKGARTLAPGRTQVNFFNNISGLYEAIEACSNGPYLEIFGNQERIGWTQWRC